MTVARNRPGFGYPGRPGKFVVTVPSGLHGSAREVRPGAG